MSTQNAEKAVVGKAPRRRSGAEREARADEVEVLRLVAEQGTVSVEQAARALGVGLEVAERRVGELVDLGWLEVRCVSGQAGKWLQLRQGGVVRAGLGYVRRVVVSAVQLPHRRAINEVRLLLESEDPVGRWVCERELWKERDSGCVPDGLWVRGKERIAIEVEVSRKVDGVLAGVLKRRLARYDRVWYFCGRHSHRRMVEVEGELGDERLEVRGLPEACLEAGERRVGVQVEPRKAEVKGLAVISEEGMVAAKWLGPLLGKSRREGFELAERLEARNFVRREHEVDGDGGWLRCTERSNDLSGTGLSFYRLHSVGVLEEKVATQVVRARLRRQHRDLEWVGRRRLAQGRKDPRSALIPSGLLVGEERRVAVKLVGRWDRSENTVRAVEGWLREYGEVWCYGDAVVCRRLRALKEERGWEGVVVKGIV